MLEGRKPRPWEDRSEAPKTWRGWVDAAFTIVGIAVFANWLVELLFRLLGW
jgi:hypothetical protein